MRRGRRILHPPAPDAVPPGAFLSAGLLSQAIGGEVGPVRQPSLQPGDARLVALVAA